MTSQKDAVFLLNDAIRTALLNPQGSKTFLKKMVSVSVGFILHQRMNFDRSNFETKTRNGVPYKVFKRKVHNPLLRRVKEWIKGALDALDKSYLRELYLIFCSEDDPTKIYESYRFQFEYLGNDAIPLRRLPTQQELKDSTDILLKAINSLDQFTQLETDKVTFKIALSYYEDVTPADYEPPYYYNTNYDAEPIMASLSSHSKCYFQLGILNTGFDIVAKRDAFATDQTLSSASNLLDDGLNDLDLDDPEKFTEDSTVLDNETQMETPESATLNDQMQAEWTEWSILNMSQSTEDELISMSDEDNSSNKIFKKIQCLCQLSAEFSHIELVMCSECSNLQHAACIGYLYAKDVADNYICKVCKFGTSFTIREVRRQRETAVCRLMVGYTYFSNEFPEEIFVELTSEVQTTIKLKLKSIRIITENDGKFGVNVQLIEKKFLKVWFPSSFIQRNKLLPDSINLMETSSQKDSLTLALKEPSQKKAKLFD